MMQILIAFDQLINTLVGLFTGDGWADETLSAKSYRKRQQGWGFVYNFINCIFFWQINHCRESYDSETYRSHLPKEYRGINTDRDKFN